MAWEVVVVPLRVAVVVGAEGFGWTVQMVQQGAYNPYMQPQVCAPSLLSGMFQWMGVAVGGDGGGCRWRGGLAGLVGHCRGRCGCCVGGGGGRARGVGGVWDVEGGAWAVE